MPSISDILGLGANLSEVAGAAVLPQLTQAYQARENERRLNQQAMLAAGIGMMTGGHGNYGAAMPAIGAGLASGMDTYQEAKKAQQIDAYKQAQIRANALKEQELDAYRKSQTALAARREQDTIAARRDSIANRKQQGEWHHDEQINQLEQRKQEALTRANQAKNTLDEAHWRTQATLAGQEQQRLQSKQIADQLSADREAQRENTATIAGARAPHVEYDTKGRGWRWDADAGKYVPAITSDDQQIVGPTKVAKAAPATDSALIKWTKQLYETERLNSNAGYKVPYDEWVAAPAVQAAITAKKSELGIIDHTNLSLGDGFSGLTVTP